MVGPGTRAAALGVATRDAALVVATRAAAVAAVVAAAALAAAAVAMGLAAEGLAVEGLPEAPAGEGQAEDLGASRAVGGATSRVGDGAMAAAVAVVAGGSTPAFRSPRPLCPSMRTLSAPPNQ